MQVVNLINKNNIIINHSLGKELGYGRDGQVFEINDNKVIKLCVLFENDYITLTINHIYDKISSILNLIEKDMPLAYVRVYEHNFLGKFRRTTINGPENYILYYYLMEKLNKISEDEAKVFSTIISHEDLNKEKKYNFLELEKILNGLNVGLDFDKQKVTLFLDNLKNTNIIQNDCHQRNILKNNNGDFKFVDLDRCYLIGD